MIKNKTIWYWANSILVDPLVDSKGSGVALNRVAEDAMLGVDMTGTLILPTPLLRVSDPRHHPTKQDIIRRSG